ncbi:phosphoglycerate mutase, partial [Dimargaris cristalligena]
LYLCRHGETDLNKLNVLQGSGVDAPLNDTGREQAQRLGNRFRSQPVDWLISSDLRRAKETAGAIQCHHPAVKFTTYPGLSEICWGIWEGRSCPKLDELIDKWNEGDFSACLEGGESPLHVENRIIEPFVSIIEQANGLDHVVIVVHGRLLRIILSSLIEGNLGWMGQYTHRNTCVNQIQVYRRCDL